MGPPTGWHCLRLLRQILDELVPGVEQFLLVDDVIAVEDGAALVPGQEHGDPFGDVRTDQVAGGGAAAIVEEAGRHPSGLAGGAPRGAPAPDRDAVAVEDERAVGVAAGSPSRQGLGDGRRDRKNPPHQGLRARGREPDDTAGLVNLIPGETKDLLLAPAGVVGEVEDVLPRGGQVGADGEVFGVLEEALAGGILAQAVGEAGHGVESTPVDGEGAHAMEGRGLPVDGAVRWYLRYSLSFRDVEELLRERGLEADHTTIWRWVQRYGPELEERLRRHLKPTNKSWRVDETYVRVKGRWCHLYRAIDSTGATINFVLSGLRDAATAKRLFRKALTDPSHPQPRVINTDQARLYGSAISGVKKAGLLRRRCRHRPVQYLNNILEQDHRAIKRRVKAKQGFREFQAARRTIQGYEAMHMIRKGQARWVSGADVRRQIQFINNLFEVVA